MSLTFALSAAKLLSSGDYTDARDLFDQTAGDGNREKHLLRASIDGRQVVLKGYTSVRAQFERLSLKEG